MNMKINQSFEKFYSMTILSFSFLFAIIYLYQSKLPPFYYQTYFSPALMVACNKSFTDVVPLDDSLARKFLNRSVTDLKCSDLPEKLSKNDGIKGGQIWFYLMHYAGYIWKITGIKWWPIDYSAALFFALSVFLAFKLLCLTVSKNIAFVSVLLFALNSIHVSFLSSFRDYSKVPFILGIVYILGHDLCFKSRYSWRIIGAFFAGSLTAIGYGFRADVGVLLPVCLLYYLFNLEFINWQRLLKKILLLFVYIAGFGVFFFPHYQILKESSTCSFHFALLGMANNIYYKLGLIPPAAYSVVNAFNDRDVAFMAHSYAERVLNIKEVVPVCSTLYDKITKELFLSFLNYFPLDFFRKAVKAPVAIMGLLILPLIMYLPIIWSQNKKYALFFYFLIIYLCSISIIQFDQRHNFYLIIFPIVATAGISNLILNSRKTYQIYTNLINKKSLLAVICICFFMLVIIDYGLFQIQSSKLKEYGEQLDGLAVKDLAENSFNKEGVEINFNFDKSKLKPDREYSELYALTINSADCKDGLVKIKLEYAFNDTNNPNYDLNRELIIKVMPQEKSKKIFIPIFYQASQKLDTWSYPDKVKILNQSRSCVGKFSLITDRSSIPLWIDFIVSHPLSYDQLKALYF